MCSLMTHMYNDSRTKITDSIQLSTVFRLHLEVTQSQNTHQTQNKACIISAL